VNGGEYISGTGGLSAHVTELRILSRDAIGRARSVPLTKGSDQDHHRTHRRHIARGLRLSQSSPFCHQAGTFPGKAVRTMSDAKVRLRYRTVIISDTHLGTKDAKARELLHFLKHIRCDKLVLNGDIIDFWSLRRKPYWTQEHTAVIRRILKMAEKKTQVVYLRGNHDDLPGDLMPLVLDLIRLESTHVHETAAGVKFLCIHGDAFDAVTTHARWLAIIGDIGYQQLLRINRH
jgi:predicted phosphodiesterase